MVFDVGCSSSLNILTHDSDGVKDIDPQQIDEPPEEDIIAPANAVRNERAMMVKHLNAYVARATVNGALGAKNHASEAELETHHACLLAVKTINDEIIFESYAPLARVLIIWLLRNEARIRSRSLVKKDIDKDPKKNSESERKVVLVSQNVIDPGKAKSERIDYVDE